MCAFCLLCYECVRYACMFSFHNMGSWDEPAHIGDVPAAPADLVIAGEEPRYETHRRRRGGAA